MEGNLNEGENKSENLSSEASKKIEEIKEKL